MKCVECDEYLTGFRRCDISLRGISSPWRMLLISPAPIHKRLRRLLKSLCASLPYSVIKGIESAGRQPGIGFVLAALLSMFLAVAA